MSKVIQLESTGTFAPADILTPKELAARLKVTLAWVYEQNRKTNGSTIPVMKVGRLLRFSWVDVSAWLRTKRRAQKAA